jgi:hypothetical protein
MPIHDDGFNDTALNGDRVIQGTIIRCNDGHWADRDSVSFPADKQMIVMAVGECAQCWKQNKPVDTIIKTPTEPLPDIDELNAKIPENEWEPGLDGKPRAPWVHQYMVYLVDPTDAAIYTFINSTAGAAIAYDRLTSRVSLMRRLRSEAVVPVVKLDAKPMKTKFGQKMRPEFTIVDWRQLGGTAMPVTNIAPPPQPQGEQKQLPAGLKPVEPVSVAEELGDEIPYLG